MTRRAVFQLVALVIAGAAVAATIAELRGIADEWSVEITTTGRKSGRPRTATIWFVQERDHVWVQAGKDGTTDWYRNLLANPEVRLDFGTLVVEGRATPIDDPKEVARVHDLFLDKYWTARIARWFGSGVGTGEVVRIDVREGGGEAADPPPAEDG